MIAIALDLEPGQVVNFETNGARYAIARAPEALPQVNDSGRATLSHGRSGRYQTTRQLSGRSDDLPAGIRIVQARPSGHWVVYDGEQIIGWAGDRQTAFEEVLAPYLADSARRARTRDVLSKARQRYL